MLSKTIYSPQIFTALSALPAKEAASFDLDGLMMGLAAQQAVAGMVRGEAMPLLVRISFDVFATRATTERFFAVCEKIDRRIQAQTPRNPPARDKVDGPSSLRERPRVPRFDRPGRGAFAWQGCEVVMHIAESREQRAEDGR